LILVSKYTLYRSTKRIIFYFRLRHTWVINSTKRLECCLYGKPW